MSFQLFVDKRRGRGRPATDESRLTVATDYVSVSPAAYEELGRPAVVELLADLKTGLVMIQASHGAASRKLTPMSSGWFRISARGFKRWVVAGLAVDVTGSRGVALRPLSMAELSGREPGGPLALVGSLVGSSRLRRGTGAGAQP